MRLLHVNTLTFSNFHVPDIPKYAIASHRQVADEEALLCDVEGRKETHKSGYQKVEGFARYKSSSELNEAINSMFYWYRDAELCLAYLVDVRAEDAHDFQGSTWFSRGWTLQELLAPATVVFLSREWQVIRHKGRTGNGPMWMGTLLNDRIATITHIPEATLQNYEESNALSVEEKLSWMAGRDTTRKEDLSYCLLGILGVSMNIRYGDGHPKTRERLLKKTRSSADELLGNGKAAISTVPFRRDPDFVERPILNREIRTRLSVPAGRAVLVGIGGVGNAARFDQSVRDVIDQLKISRRTDSNSNQLRLLQDWLRGQSNGRWLVVLDNADDASFLLEPPAVADEAIPVQKRIDYFPPCDHGSMIITSRSRLEALKLRTYEKDIVDVLQMSEKEAETLLVRKLDREEPSSNDSLLERALDLIPLAITQTAAYINKKGSRCSVQQYLQEVEQSRSTRTSLLRRDNPLPNRDDDASNSVLSTWRISFEYIYENQTSAANLLSLMSFCDRLAIPEILLRAVVETIQNDTFEEDIDTLRSLSFVHDTADRYTWEMHRLVQDATQLWLQDRSLSDKVYSQFITKLDKTLPVPVDFKDWPLYRALFAHVKHAAGNRPSMPAALLEWASIMYKSGQFTRVQGDYDNALAMEMSAVTTRSELLGKEDIKTLDSMTELASALVDYRRYAEAERVEISVMETSLTTLGQDNPRTLISMANLANTYANQSRFVEAEQLHVKVLETEKRVLGENRPDTVMTMANLASIRLEQCYLAEAEQPCTKVLKIRKEVPGGEHPDTLDGLRKLAATYRKQHRAVEAEQLLLKAQEIQKVVLGEDHPNTLLSAANLACTYERQGRFAEAEQLHNKVLETRRTVLGEEHHRTLRSMCHLAQTYAKQRKWREANDIQARAAERLVKVLGAQHPKTMSVAAFLKRIRREGRRAMIKDVECNELSNSGSQILQKFSHGSSRGDSQRAGPKHPGGPSENFNFDGARSC